MKNMRSSAMKIVLLVLAIGAAGCAIERERHAVPLHYEGPAFSRVIPAGVKVPSIAVSPFQDNREQKDRLGHYVRHRLIVDLVPDQRPVAESLTQMVRERLQNAGFRTSSGTWDGSLDTVSEQKSDYVLFGKIRILDFTDRGQFVKAQRRGTVILEFRLGDPRARRIQTRTVEVTPKDINIKFTGTQSELAAFDSIIRKTISTALSEGLSSVIQKMTPTNR
ncbi:MAG: hypothetical protein O2807_00845 [bacterium]|nr:hypothetical protein [bacterium]